MKNSLLALTLSAGIVFTGCDASQMPWAKKSGEPVAELESVDSAGTTTIPEPGLQLSAEQRFSDLPLPLGAKQDQERSFIYESPTLQVGRMVYSSKAGLNELSQFFIRECPTANWKLQNVTEAGGTQLVFNKPDRQLTITILDLGVGRGREIILLLIPDASN